jgi:hypothetical protein
VSMWQFDSSSTLAEQNAEIPAPACKAAHAYNAVVAHCTATLCGSLGAGAVKCRGAASMVLDRHERSTKGLLHTSAPILVDMS